MSRRAKNQGKAEGDWIRVLVNGAAGKMGIVTCDAVDGDPDLKLVAKAGRDDDLSALISKHKPQVVVDFTNCDVVLDNMQVMIEHGVHPVIGTSGLLPEDVKTLQQQCQSVKLGGIIAPNFSIGMVLMMQLCQRAASYLPHAEIVESHHAEKHDAPSGTAIKTAEMIAAGRSTTPLTPNCQETIPHARGATLDHVPIHSVRVPGLVAQQMVIFGGHNETLTLRHDTLNRHCFMPGVLLACKRVIGLKQLVYGLESLL